MTQRLDQNPAQGVALMLAAILTFSVMDATAKALVQNYAPGQVVWVRFFGQFLLALVLLNRHLPRTLRTAHPGMHLLRSLFQVGAIGFFFLSLQHIGLAETTAIGDTSPVLITLGAALFLGERLGPRRVIGIAVALTGALIIIRPGAATFSPWAILPFLSALCYTGNALLTRALGLKDPIWTSMLWGGLVGVVITSLPLPLYWTPIALADLPLFLVVGVLGTVAQLFLIRSFSVAEASLVAPFTYCGIVFATIWGVLLYDEWPDGWTVVGALVIVGAGLYVWHRETAVRKPRP
ncbi:MAG: DMT family transporter [Rhodobacteraceae bacterium]|jgi:drug/metabolite transporter (DMT)-like permease|nr:DMT family transporter [Paracoccaceae bacterium]